MGGAQSVATRHIISCFGKPASAPYLCATGSGNSADAFTAVIAKRRVNQESAERCTRADTEHEMTVTAATTQPRRDHIAELDGLRAFAILSVMATHLLVATPALTHASTGLPHALDVIIGHGWLGVDMFFVLSGFLITNILLSTKHRAVVAYYGRFYQRRVLRIVPLYLTVLAVFAVAYIASVGPGYFLLCLAFAANLAPLTNVAIPNGGGPLWSLAVEEQFYLVWPVLVLLLGRRTLMFVLAGILLVEPVLRLVFATQPIELTWFRCDGLVS